ECGGFAALLGSGGQLVVVALSSSLPIGPAGGGRREGLGGGLAGQGVLGGEGFAPDGRGLGKEPGPQGLSATTAGAAGPTGNDGGMARGTADGGGKKKSATRREEVVGIRKAAANVARADTGGHGTGAAGKAKCSPGKKGPAAARGAARGAAKGAAARVAGSVGKVHGASATSPVSRPPVRNAGEKRKNCSAGVASGGIVGAEIVPHSRKDAAPDRHAVLLQEIISLGGSKEDFELLKDVDSDGEEASSKVAAGRRPNKELPTDEHTLNKELQAFLKSINYDPAVAAEGAVADEGNESEDAFGEPDKEEMVAESREKDDAKTKKGLLGKEDPPPAAGARPKPKMVGVAELTFGWIQPTPRWYDIELPPVLASGAKVSKAAAESKLAEGMKLLEEENAARQAKPALSSGDQSFLSMLFRSGTLHDRISAMTLAVQESPLHAVKSLDSLMGFLKKNGRREAVMTIASLKDLLASGLLPDRKLKYVVRAALRSFSGSGSMLSTNGGIVMPYRYFRDQPSTQPNVTEAHLILWAFEDYLKKLYFEFIQAIEVGAATTLFTLCVCRWGLRFEAYFQRLSHDTLLHVKQTMLQAVYDLLAAKPEQEQNLLRLLMNKLGDIERKIASKASFLLQQLLVAHPNMKGVVVEECEQTLLRKNVGIRLQYY
ncbi:MAG: hypothetical protein BJ554DRAFT_2414, partial [Olpidium bornovanus]